MEVEFFTSESSMSIIWTPFCLVGHRTSFPSTLLFQSQIQDLRDNN